MGLMDFLNNAYKKFEDAKPHMMEQMQKLEERAEREREKEYRRQQEIEEYKTEYSKLSNKVLKNEFDRETSNERRAAILSVKKERDLKVNRYKAEYSDLSYDDLMMEQRMIGLLHKEDADLRMTAISLIIKERGF